jgi:hypothetical protein
VLEIISPRSIEQSCRPEWKRKTRPKLENERISFSHHKSEQKQRKIIVDNHGNPVQEKAENDYSDSSPEVDLIQDVKGTAQHDNELLKRQHSIIRELVNENKKLRQEMDVQKQREIDLLRKLENHANSSDQYQNVIDVEFPLEYRPLQNHTAQIFKSPTRQEVWFTLKIDVDKQKVVSVQIGRKLLSQNIMETGNGK